MGLYEFFWIAVGAVLSFVGSHLYHNNKFKQGLQEEIARARTGLKERL